MRFGIIALVLFAPSVVMADPVEDILAQAEADCAALDSGEFTAEDAVQVVDLDGEEPVDRIVDSAAFSCSSSPGYYCGSGGCSIYAVIGDRSWEFQAEGWTMLEWDGRPILMVARDGGWCGGAGAQQCYEAIVWSFGEMLTVMPQQ
jgi:hypothetical protein